MAQEKGGFKISSLFVHSAVNGYPVLFRAGEGEDGEEEEWRPTSITPLPVQVVSLTDSS